MGQWPPNRRHFSRKRIGEYFLYEDLGHEEMWASLKKSSAMAFCIINVLSVLTLTMLQTAQHTEDNHNAEFNRKLSLQDYLKYLEVWILAHWDMCLRDVHREFCRVPTLQTISHSRKENSDLDTWIGNWTRIGFAVAKKCSGRNSLCPMFGRVPWSDVSHILSAFPMPVPYAYHRSIWT